MIDRFGDPERGGFFSTSADHEELIARRKEIGDHPIPSGNSRRRAGPAAPRRAERRARLRATRPRASSASSPNRATDHPEAFAHLLRALDFHLAPTKEVALVGDDLDELAAVVRAGFRPHLVLAGGPEGTDASPSCSATAPRSTASPPPTSARTSPAGRP